MPTNPTEGYTKNNEAEYTEKNDALYLLWVKRTGQNCKDVFSCIVHDGLPEATTVVEYTTPAIEGPTVESIYVASQNSGTYNISQTVKINVKFSEEITGTTVPTIIVVIVAIAVITIIKM